MNGHTDTVTGLRLSPDGSFLLSNAMDNTGKSNKQTNKQTAKQNITTILKHLGLIF